MRTVESVAETLLQILVSRETLQIKIVEFHTQPPKLIEYSVQYQ